MGSDLKRIMARLESLTAARAADRDPPPPAAEPGESRYQRRSARLRERIAAVEIEDEDIRVDLTDG